MAMFLLFSGKQPLTQETVQGFEELLKKDKNKTEALPEYCEKQVNHPGPPAKGRLAKASLGLTRESGNQPTTLRGTVKDRCRNASSVSGTSKSEMQKEWLRLPKTTRQIVLA